MRDCPRKLDPSLQVEVVHCVAVLVVVHIVRDAGSTTEHLKLLLRLDALSATCNATSRNTSLKEGPVVRSAVELDLGVVEAQVVEVGSELVLRLRGTGRAGGVVSTAIAVVDLDGVVGAGHHVEVEEQADLVLLRLRELLNVVLCAQQAGLLAGPPGEADGVVDGELAELDGDLEEGDGARAVVVDSRSGGDRVGVAADVDDVVVVTSDGLSNDVV